MSGEFVSNPFDHSTGLDVGSFNSQDEFLGYGTLFNNPDRFVLQMSKRIHMLNPTAAPFLSWASAVRKRPTGGTHYSWMEDELFTHRDVKAVVKYNSTEEVYTLQLKNPGDWQAFEAAAEGDVWYDNKPMIHMLITPVGSTAPVLGVIIKQPALYLGPTHRSYTGVAGTATLINEIVLAENNTTPVIGGDNAEVDEIPLHDGTHGTWVNGTDYGFGLDFTQTDWYASIGADKNTDVYVQVVTPQEYLKGFAQGSGLANESRKRSRTYGNHTQIFKKSWTIADTLLKSEMYGPSELARLRLRKTIEHKVDIERALFFQGGGVEHTDWGSLPEAGKTNPKTVFKGLGVGVTDRSKAGFINTKNAEWETDFVLPTAATLSDVNTLVGAVFDDSVDSPSSTKVAFCSMKWPVKLGQMALQTGGDGFMEFGQRMQAGNAIGIRGVNTLMSPAGMIHFVYTPLLRGIYENYAVVLDMNNIEIRPFKGRDTQLHSNAGSPDIDGRLDYLLTELGIEVHHEGTHALLKLG